MQVIKTWRVLLQKVVKQSSNFQSQVWVKELPQVKQKLMLLQLMKVE